MMIYGRMCEREKERNRQDIHVHKYRDMYIVLFLDLFFIMNILTIYSDPH